MYHSSPRLFYTVMLTSEPQVKDVHDINPPGILSTQELILAHKEAIATHAILLPPPPSPAPPPPPSSSKQMIKYSPKPPLPLFPNNSSCNCWRDGRQVANKNFACGGCHRWWKWQEKKVNDGGQRRRWKNNRGDYQEILKLNPEDNPTTVMIRNIPNRYTRELLLQTLDNHCKMENDVDNSLISAYDFVYLPIDFQRRVNAGFAFVNFTNTEAALRFWDAFSGNRWDLFESKKTAEITKAKIQGRKELVKSLEERNFLYGPEEDLPVWFDPARDGSGRVESQMKTVGKCLLLGKKKGSSNSCKIQNVLT